MSGQSNPVSCNGLIIIDLSETFSAWGRVVIILAGTESSTERKLTTVRRELADFLPRDQFSET